MILAGPKTTELLLIEWPGAIARAPKLLLGWGITSDVMEIGY